jgi:nitroreductase
VDTYLAIVGKREVRTYLNKPVPEAILTQILEAGRASGSSRNRQPWKFVVITDRPRLAQLSTFVSRQTNLTGCAAAIVVALTNPRSAFDGGRTAQNMMLAAWALGVGTCPNTPMDEAGVKGLLGLPEETAIPTILSLGYPAPGERRPRANADPARVLARINRLPLTDLVHRETIAD